MLYLEANIECIHNALLLLVSLFARVAVLPVPS